MEKREIIIPAKSIKVGENKLPEKVSICETSPFSDGYDYYGEKERLSMIPESEQFLHQNALDLFGQRELMLKEAIYKKDFFARNQKGDVGIFCRSDFAALLCRQWRKCLQ